ncbi:formimidoylglutamase [Mesonia sp. K7]|uniref:formimidoylglutamase n=1 Tax=Mesonia sp. K7 TaxID=2218606 RepID=UPI000DA9A6E1|nr:formimidoylglutamase [Mesonia sp. K7]PZD79373.1 arginase [Mesonia sp. K7]
MEHFDFFTPQTASQYTNQREGETKLGESLSFVSGFDQLHQKEQGYVIFGIPEDIGVRANYGQPGTANAWYGFLKAFLNVQQNEYNTTDNFLILGSVNTDRWMQEAEGKSPSELGEIVEEIDDTVEKVVENIVRANKTPIIIGGGHNNAYGNICGTSFALEKPISVLNIDAHTDLRKVDFRHSGNGFTKALQEEHLDKYMVIGLHRNYTPQYIFEMMNDSKNLSFMLLNDFLHLSTIDKLIKFKKATDYVKNQFGLEIDCDAIEHFNSSAQSPTGFSINDIRSFIKIAKKQEVLYLHLCETITDTHNMTGKALAFFVTDFIRTTD